MRKITRRFRWMKSKVAVKSLSWAVVSGSIIFTTAYVETGGMLRAAFMTALVSALLKTPFYSVHEWGFDRLWSRLTPVPKRPVKVSMNNIVKAFRRGLLTWDEAREVLLGEGLSEQDVVSQIGTHADYMAKAA